MKLILFPSCLLLFTTNFLFSQENISTSGGNATGSGSSSYSVGQMVVNTNSSNNGSVAQGIQQSIELFTLNNPDTKNTHLKAVTFPNPTKDQVILSISKNSLDNLAFTVFDIRGRLLKNGKISNDKTTISIKDLPNGIYLLKVHQHKKELKVFKIIKN